jgi:GrpB-like predicted nucleotidyltransferase (UPF0157 family)
MSRQVLFIRHAMPAVDKAVSSRLWPLSEEGREEAEDLAERLQLPESIYVVCSDEVKAKETAAAFSEQVVVDARVQEVTRPWMDGDYKSIARNWLSGEPVEGWESQDTVLIRMSDAVEEALEKADGPVVVVTHGMAMSAYIARVADLDSMRFWSGLGFPDVRIVDIEQGQVEDPGADPKGPVEVVPYDPSWPDTFREIADRVSAVLGPLAPSIEHVGSTAVPGISAKPIIDIDVVIESSDEFAAVRDRLEEAGYRWEGDLGIADREAFGRPSGSPPHHLYVCVQGARPLREHIAFRDYLRSHPDVTAEYSQLKEQLADRHRLSRDAYSEAKTDFVAKVLGRAGRQSG